jgi:hypothetical protein
MNLTVAYGARRLSARRWRRLRRCPCRVYVPVGADAGGTNQAIGHRWHWLARASGPASCVPRVNAAFYGDKA